MRSIVRSSVALMVGILLPVVGCDKAKPARPVVDAVLPPGAPEIPLGAKPELLFQLFGDRKNPQLVPLAAVVNGTIKAIGLTAREWKQLDSTYFAPGSKYPLYHDGMEVGEVTVTRGMFVAGDSALYTLPGCEILKPLAAATIQLNDRLTDPSGELIASTSPLGNRPPYKGSLPTEDEVAKLGHTFGHEVGRKAGLVPAELDSLDFHARMIVTGAASDPTLLVSFIDPNAGDLGPGAGQTSHLFALGDKNGAGYDATYRHAVSGNAKTVEFQRIVDHLDVNGDGVDEIVLESWKFGAESELVVLSFRAGQWREVLRVKQSLCLDPPKVR